MASLPDGPDRRTGIRIFLDAYGPLPPFDVVEAVVARRGAINAQVQALPGQGFEPRQTWVADGMVKEETAKIDGGGGPRPLIEAIREDRGVTGGRKAVRMIIEGTGTIVRGDTSGLELAAARRPAGAGAEVATFDPTQMLHGEVIRARARDLHGAPMSTPRDRPVEDVSRLRGRGRRRRHHGSAVPA
jgi:hypothetical protein